MRRRDWLAAAAGGLGVALVGPSARAAAAPRLLSAGGSITELVYRLGAGGQLLATDSTSLFPAEAARLPKLGYHRALSAEGLLAQRADLLLASADAGPPQVLDQVQAAGLRVLRGVPGHGFAALQSQIGWLAAALGRPAEGRQLAGFIEAERARLAAAIRPGPVAPRVLFVLSHAAGNVQVAGSGTAAQTLIELAGGRNALQGVQGYRPLSAEAAVAAAPDWILGTLQGLDALGGVPALLARPGLALTPAGRAGRVLAFDALLMLGHGPRLPQAIEQLARGLGTLA
ncbi:heme/hemin ABC transporter substrate-binding protein [Aquariibacter lacus]|uniref:heme/hemin ABC transporter substrate-binding protein n=1 Tax=Aquariibacter lacus TaxID=2801332 RepID=UPI0025748B28|nr:ABC transporter substrate-binding protein [Piscinibacter lacus]